MIDGRLIDGFSFSQMSKPIAATTEIEKKYRNIILVGTPVPIKGMLREFKKIPNGVASNKKYIKTAHPKKNQKNSFFFLNKATRIKIRGKTPT